MEKFDLKELIPKTVEEISDSAFPRASEFLFNLGLILKQFGLNNGQLTNNDFLGCLDLLIRSYLNALANQASQIVYPGDSDSEEEDLEEDDPKVIVFPGNPNWPN